MTNIWIEKPQECSEKYKGKMVRCHLRHNIIIDGLLVNHSKKSFLVARPINKKVHLMSISWKRINAIEILKGLTLSDRKNICNFIYSSVN